MMPYTAESSETAKDACAMYCHELDGHCLYPATDGLLCSVSRISRFGGPLVPRVSVQHPSVHNPGLLYLSAFTLDRFKVPGFWIISRSIDLVLIVQK